MSTKLITLADELSLRNDQDGSSSDAASTPQSLQQQSPQLAAAGMTTLASVDQELSGQTFAAKYIDQVLVSTTDYPFVQVTQYVSWQGSTAALRGNGISYTFSDAVTAVVSGQTVQTITETANKSNGTTTNIGTFDILAYSSDDILLGQGNYTPGVGYTAYYVLQDTPLGNAGANLTLPLNVGTDPNVNPGLPPCYLAGTRVETARGEVAVEDVQVGDLVRTVNGAGGFKPVIWIGHRALNASHHPEPEQVAPIRIRAGAFADGAPIRDLLVSPDHALFTDGVLIPARLLINGGSIAQDMTIRAIRYFHLELDSHSVMLAEGLPAESYLAGANRGAFANADAPVELHPTFATDVEAYASRACAPMVVDAAAVLPIWSRVAARGSSLGLTPSLPAVTADAGFRVVAGGDALTASVEGDVLAFVLPRGTKSVRLVSRGARPADTRPWLDDRRRLGVMVAGLAVQTGRGRKVVPMADASLTEGWWAVEASPVGAARWTNGDAAVTLPPGAKTLYVRLVGDMSYPVEAAA